MGKGGLEFECSIFGAAGDCGGTGSNRTTHGPAPSYDGLWGDRDDGHSVDCARSVERQMVELFKTRKPTCLRFGAQYALVR